MRIAIFAETFLPRVDGISMTLGHLLEHLREKGHQSLVFAPKGAPREYAGSQIIGLTGLPMPLYPGLKLVPPGTDVSPELTAFDPDLVHVVNPAFLGLVGIRQARLLDVPVVASYHTDLPGYAEHYGLSFLRDPLWMYFRWVHNKADLTLCPSEFTRVELIGHGFERVGIWGRGVDADRYSPHWRRHEWRERLTDGHPDAPLLLYVGRLAREKRLHWLRPVLRAVPQARLAIVGGGPEGGELQVLLKDTATVFTGHLEGDDLSCAYAAGDIFVFPSASETFGNVVLEAMASGLPAIVPSYGGPVDHVHDGENGFVFDTDSLGDLIALARWLVEDREYARELGAGALAYARTQTWEATLDGLLDHYQVTIERHQRARQDEASMGAALRAFTTFMQTLASEATTMPVEDDNALGERITEWLSEWFGDKHADRPMEGLGERLGGWLTDHLAEGLSDIAEGGADDEDQWTR